MPSGTINGSTGNQYIDSKIEWSYTQNVSANTSTITAALYYKRNNTGYATSGTGTFTISIGGIIASATKTLNITESAWVKAVEGSATIAHNGDGTKLVYITASGSISGTSLSSTNCNKTITLDTIPRASTITSANNVTLGGRCSIKWTPASTSFYYKVKFSIGSWSYTTVAFRPGTTSAYTYTGYPIPMDVATNFPNAESGTMTATLYTYSDSGGTKQIGSESSKTFTVTLPENEDTKPSITMTLAPDTPYEKFASLYLQGRSRVKATFSGKGKYGASIVAYSLQAEGGRYTEPNASGEYISNILAQSGESTIGGFVSDSRWFGNYTPQTINVIAYSSPYIAPYAGHKKVICERCTEDGASSDSGTYLHVKGTRNYTKINTDGIVNNCSVRCRYKPEGGVWSHESGKGVGVLLDTDTSTDAFDVILPNIVTDTTLSYTVELNIVDDTNLPSTMEFLIPSEDVTFHLREGGGGAALGKYSITKDLFDCAYSAKFHKGISIHSEAVSDFVVEQGLTDIWYYRKWYSGRAECWGRRAVSVNISTKWEAIYYNTVDKYAFPSGLFTYAPMCQVTAEFGSTLQSGWLGIGGEASKDYTPGVIFCRPNIAEAGFDILYYAMGSWK